MNEVNLNDCLNSGLRIGISLALHCYQEEFKEAIKKIKETSNVSENASYLLTLLEGYADTKVMQAINAARGDQADIFPEILGGCINCSIDHPERIQNCYLKTKEGYQFRGKE